MTPQQPKSGPFLHDAGERWLHIIAKEHWHEIIAALRYSASAQDINMPLPKSISRAILPGEQYERVFMVYERQPDTYKTCQRCLALRDYVEAHVPCFCWAHGNMIEDAVQTADAYAHEAPGLLFGAYRRQVLIQREAKVQPIKRGL